jgi:hypothetical protein
VVPKSDYLATFVVKIGDHMTQLNAPESTEIAEICDRAAVEMGLKIRKWKTVIQRNGLRIFVACTSPEPIIIKASIHFGKK